jgi:hypothetical protein
MYYLDLPGLCSLFFINELFEIIFNLIHSFANASALYGRIPAGSLKVARRQLADSIHSDLTKDDARGKEWLVVFMHSRTLNSLFAC